jgi:DNA-binding NtrC family response regulator
MNSGMFEPSASFLQKPFEMDALWQILRQALGPSNRTQE